MKKQQRIGNRKAEKTIWKKGMRVEWTGRSTFEPVRQGTIQMLLGSMGVVRVDEVVVVPLRHVTLVKSKTSLTTVKRTAKKAAA